MSLIYTYLIELIIQLVMYDSRDLYLPMTDSTLLKL